MFGSVNPLSFAAKSEEAVELLCEKRLAKYLVSARRNFGLIGGRSHAQFAYVTNSGDNTVSSYTINPVTGAWIAGSPFPAGAQPNSVAVDPSGKFACVANIGGNVSGYTIKPVTGALTAIAGSPFSAGDFPRSLAVDPSGSFVYVPEFQPRRAVRQK